MCCKLLAHNSMCTTLRPTVYESTKMICLRVGLLPFISGQRDGTIPIVGVLEFQYSNLKDI